MGPLILLVYATVRLGADISSGAVGEGVARPRDVLSFGAQTIALGSEHSRSVATPQSWRHADTASCGNSVGTNYLGNTLGATTIPVNSNFYDGLEIPIVAPTTARRDAVHSRSGDSDERRLSAACKQRKQCVLTR